MAKPALASRGRQRRGVVEWWERMISTDERHSLRPARLIVVMGVSGCGKSSVGTALAAKMGKPFLDADDYHPPSNVEKMSRGVPLTDADRWPWLDRFAEVMRDHADKAGTAVSACSALRRIYRDRLVASAGEPILFIFLRGSREQIAERLARRTDHFMPAALLDSQFTTLEQPDADENVLVVDIGPPVDAVTTTILEALSEES